MKQFPVITLTKLVITCLVLLPTVGCGSEPGGAKTDPNALTVRESQAILRDALTIAKYCKVVVALDHVVSDKQTVAYIKARQGMIDAYRAHPRGVLAKPTGTTVRATVVDSANLMESTGCAPEDAAELDRVLKYG